MRVDKIDQNASARGQYFMVEHLFALFAGHGFAHAHMGRSFRAVFGITPSELLKMTIAFRRDGLFSA
jgi:hypothetical protein